MGYLIYLYRGLRILDWNQFSSLTRQDCKAMTDFVCFPINNQGVAMAISTAAFGVYFYLMSKLNSSTTEEPHTDLAWLALASMAVFITGKILGGGSTLSLL